MRSRFSTLHLESTTALWSPGMARTGFIEGAILLALTSAGVSGGALGFLTTGLTALATAGLSIGASLIGNALFGPKPVTPKAQDIQANIRQGLSARRRHYGRNRVGSIVVFGFRRAEKLYILHYIGEGPIQSYEAFFLDRKPVTLDVNGFVTENQYRTEDNTHPVMQILTTLGTMTDEPFAEILDAFPELNRPLKPFRHRGCAMVLQIVEEVAQEDLAAVYPNNLPALQATIEGLLPYDPRTGLSAYSTNAGVCLLTEIMDVYGLTSASTDEIDFDSFSDFADHCDEPVNLKAGGTEARYRCAGTITMDSENEKRIKAIADICNADVYISPQGKIAVRKRLSTTPLIELKAIDGDHLSISLESGRREQKKFNAVKVVYREEALNWKENEAYYRNAEAKLVDGRELIEPLDAAMCPSGTQAQRLGKLFFHERNPETIGRAVSGMQALELIEDPVFSIDLAPEDDLAFIARSGNLEFEAASQTVSFDLQSVAEDAESWDPETEEQDVVEEAPTLLSEVEDILLDVTAAVGLLSNSAPVINFSWIVDGGGTVPAAYAQQVQVSLADEEEWIDATVNQAQDTARFGPLADGAAYDWRIRNIRGGTKYDWQLSASPIVVTVDPVSPGALSGVSVTAGLGYATISFTSPATLNGKKVRIYRKAGSGGTLNRATDFLADVIVSPAGGAYSKVDGDNARVNLLANGDFAAIGLWSVGANWTIAGGVATKTSPTIGALSQTFAGGALTNGQQYVLTVDATWTGGSFQADLLGGATLNGPIWSSAATNGTRTYTFTATAAHTSMRIQGYTNSAGVFDNASLYQKSVTSISGVYTYWLELLNGSDVPGTLSGPHVATIR